MKSIIKWGAIICAGLIVVVIAALLIIPMFVDVQTYKPELEKWVSEKTGRSFSVGSDLALSLFPWAGVSFSDLRLGNPSGFAEKEFVAVKSFEVRVKLLPLISKDIQVKRFVLNEPRIELVKNKNGRVNWEFPRRATEPDNASTSPAAKPPEAGLPISNLMVGDFSITNGVVLWLDHSTDTRIEVSALNLQLKDVSLDRPVQLVFSAQLDNQPVSMEGAIGPAAKGLQDGNVPMDLTVKAVEQLAVRLQGRLENPAASPGAELDIEVAEFSPRKLMAALGQPFPLTTADPNTLTRIALKAHVKATAQLISISDALVTIDDSTLSFSTKASEFSRPAIAFDLNLDQINLDRYLPPPAEKKQAPDQPAQESSAPKSHQIDYAPLRQLVMDGQLKIGNLVVSKANVQDILLKITAKNGIIALDPITLKMYAGAAVAKARVNVQADSPKSNLDLDVTNIQVNPLLKDTMGQDILEGTTNARLTLSMIGDEAATIKKSLNGQGQLAFTDGAIKGIDLAGMVRNITAAFSGEPIGERPRTDFSELLAPFSITNGVVNTAQTSLKSPLLRIIASGNADLVNETLDFRVEPKVVGSIKGQGDNEQRSGILVPVVVSGTFAAPKFSPDLKAVAAQALEKKVLESDQVKKALEKKELKPLQDQTKGLLKGVLGQ